MQTNGNTILITGGGTGIGRGLAEAFHALGNQVIITGRREEPLKKTTAANAGMEYMTLDVQHAESTAAFCKEIVKRFPMLNVVIHNAGIAQVENLLEPAEGSSVIESTITTNLIAPLRLTASLMPQLLAQPHATIVTVSSGLAFVPLAPSPTYSATKAALHSWTESLRYQLRNTKVEVLEIIPPYVQTELGGSQQASDPRAMPLADFITEVMQLIASQPASGEINVERVYPLRYAADSGPDKIKGQQKYEAFFTNMNNMFAGH